MSSELKNGTGRARFLGVLACLVIVSAGPPALADDYSDPDYLMYDLDNMRRTTQRQERHFTSRDYQDASFDTFNEVWLRGVARQVGDIGQLRLYTGLGQILPGGNVGDPERYWLGDRTTVEFFGRQGAKLIGNVWPCAQGACPGIVITTGSIQVTQHMYGWAARALQNAGYTVFTFDVQGQGESEGTSHDPSNPFPVLRNPQEEANFVESTIDAIHFFHSTESDPYVPVGWDADRVEEAKEEAGGSDLVHWFNPRHDRVDRTRLGLAGHSLGATAVSRVQQCSDLNTGTVPTLCASEGPPGVSGQPTWKFPIKAIVAWDSLSRGTDPNPIIPIVPALDHRADGYFINAVPTTSAPSSDPSVDPLKSRLAPFNAWKAAGKDAYTITVRGGTHAEWSEIPYIVSGTCYGTVQAAYYMLAWFDRYVHGGRAANATARLRNGPKPDEDPGFHLPWRASLFSVKYPSAFRITRPNQQVLTQDNLRAYAGVAAMGDWEAANEEMEGWPNPCAAEPPVELP